MIDVLYNSVMGIKPLSPALFYQADSHRNTTIEACSAVLEPRVISAQSIKVMQYCLPISVIRYHALFLFPFIVQVLQTS